ncbi:MAG: Gfo/Idh/MocA family oxidoreductase [Actinomycetota bacterium]|nr:Gfo/Idh/MocA family oxidoreductase [Actinomycetota bacterium]
MIDLFEPVARACAIEVPVAHRRRIALVGAGAIADVAHLPAYRSGGLEVVGLTDPDAGRAHEVADRHGVGTVYADLEELLSDGRVEVVDVAVPASAQPAIVRRALESGRHVLGQKPFAPSAAVAAELVALASERGSVLAVNQQLRFDEGMAAAHEMARLGWLGEVTSLTISVDIWTEWTSWPWMLEVDELEVWNHSIHYHDVVRWFLGEPSTVFASAGRTPGQAPRGETRTTTVYEFPSGTTALVAAHHENRWGDQSATFRVDGSAGSVRGTLGLLYDYPSRRPDTLEVTSEVLGTDGWVPYPVTTRWIPDAFLGPMASLLAAAAGGEEPRTAARDNVGTLAVVEAIYRSIRTGTAQAPLLGGGMVVK